MALAPLAFSAMNGLVQPGTRLPTRAIEFVRALKSLASSLAML